MVFEFEVKTDRRNTLVDVTSLLDKALDESGVKQGVLTAFVPHTTAGITINENADPSVKRDILLTLEKLIPEHGDYRHLEGNSDAHLKASLFGSSEQVIINRGRLVLGTWQGVYFSEFDGPRTRKLVVNIDGKE